MKLTRLGQKFAERLASWRESRATRLSQGLSVRERSPEVLETIFESALDAYRRKHLNLLDHEEGLQARLSKEEKRFLGGLSSDRRLASILSNLQRIRIMRLMTEIVHDDYTYEHLFEADLQNDPRVRLAKSMATKMVLFEKGHRRPMEAAELQAFLSGRPQRGWIAELLKDRIDYMTIPRGLGLGAAPGAADEKRIERETYPFSKPPAWKKKRRPKKASNAEFRRQLNEREPLKSRLLQNRSQLIPPVTKEIARARRMPSEEFLRRLFNEFLEGPRL